MEKVETVDKMAAGVRYCGEDSYREKMDYERRIFR